MRALMLIKEALAFTVGEASLDELAHLTGIHPDLIAKHGDFIKNNLGHLSLDDYRTSPHIKGVIESREFMENAGRATKKIGKLVGYGGLGALGVGGVAAASQ